MKFRKCAASVAVAAAILATASTNATAANISHADRAMAMALRAISVESRSHSIPADFLLVIATGANVYDPGEFVGRRGIASDGEILYAGLIYRNGIAVLQTGP